MMMDERGWGLGVERGAIRKVPRLYHSVSLGVIFVISGFELGDLRCIAFLVFKGLISVILVWTFGVVWKNL